MLVVEHAREQYCKSHVRTSPVIVDGLGGTVLGTRSRIHIGYYPMWTFHQSIAFSHSTIDVSVRTVASHSADCWTRSLFWLISRFLPRTISALPGSLEYSTIVTNCVYPVGRISIYHRDASKQPLKGTRLKCSTRTDPTGSRSFDQIPACCSTHHDGPHS